MTTTSQAPEADHIQNQLCQRIEELEADKLALIDANDRLRLEAQIHAQEARTQRATVHEIYQVVTVCKGEPGDWNGARPVREAFERLRNDNAELRRQLTSMRCP